MCCQLSEDLKVVLRHGSAVELNIYNALAVLRVREPYIKPFSSKSFKGL
jgi:hypothetical protein